MYCLNIAPKTVAFVGTKEFNEFPLKVKNIENIAVFKGALKTFFVSRAHYSTSKSKCLKTKIMQLLYCKLKEVELKLDYSMCFVDIIYICVVFIIKNFCLTMKFVYDFFCLVIKCCGNKIK